MKCERCGAEKAEIHLVKIINGERHVEHLCRKCARELYPLDDSSKMLKMTLSVEGMMELQDMLKDILRADLPELLGNKGNADDSADLSSVLEFLSGDIDDSDDEHAEPAQEPLNSLDYNEIKDLKNELQLAVKDERYERAAELRDRIKELEHSDSQQ